VHERHRGFVVTTAVFERGPSSDDLEIGRGRRANCAMGGNGVEGIATPVEQ
jgi:hypothetical protein